MTQHSATAQSKPARFESLADAAERTGVCVQTLRRRISAGDLTAYRLGPRMIRLNPDDVDRMLTKIPTAW